MTAEAFYGAQLSEKATQEVAFSRACSGFLYRSFGPQDRLPFKLDRVYARFM